MAKGRKAAAPRLSAQLLPLLAKPNSAIGLFVEMQGRHEGNVEQIFSLGGRLSDPNMNPAYLATLVFIGSNYKFYMPPVKDIWQRYLRKFSKQGKLLENELDLQIKAESGESAE